MNPTSPTAQTALIDSINVSSKTDLGIKIDGCCHESAHRIFFYTRSLTLLERPVGLPCVIIEFGLPSAHAADDAPAMFAREVP